MSQGSIKHHQQLGETSLETRPPITTSPARKNDQRLEGYRDTQNTALGCIQKGLSGNRGSRNQSTKTAQWDLTLEK